MLIEAKGFGYKIDEKQGIWKQGYVSRKMQEKLLQQANRQLQAAKSVGRALQWVVPNAGIQSAFARLLGQQIPVLVAEPKNGCPKSTSTDEGASGGSF